IEVDLGRQECAVKQRRRANSKSHLLNAGDGHSVVPKSAKPERLQPERLMARDPRYYNIVYLESQVGIEGVQRPLQGSNEKSDVNGVAAGKSPREQKRSRHGANEQHRDNFERQPQFYRHRLQSPSTTKNAKNRLYAAQPAPRRAVESSL